MYLHTENKITICNRKKMMIMCVVFNEEMKNIIL